MNKIFSALGILLGLTCVLCAQVQEETGPFVMSQMAVYFPPLPQKDGSLLVAEDFTYASEGIDFYNTPDGSLYLENGGNLIRFSPDKPGLPIVQGVWNGYTDQYARMKLKEYAFPSFEQNSLTLYCTPDKTQFITLQMTGEGEHSVYKITWHDTAKKISKPLDIKEKLYSTITALPSYAYCKGDVFYYPATVRIVKNGTDIATSDLLRALHISTGKDEVFFSAYPNYPKARLQGPIAVPGTDYLLYQASLYNEHKTLIWMKKALK